MAVKEPPKNKRLKVDRSALKMMFATGKTIDEIATATGIKLGTIQAWSYRDKWMEAREQVQTSVKTALETSQSIAVNTAEAGKLWPSRVAAIADKGLKVLEREEPIDLKSVDRLATVTDKIDRLARRSYGLDEEGKSATTVVNLGLLQLPEPQRVVAEIVSG